MTEFEGRVIVVTGAARGQGAAIARRLAGEGATVVVADVLADEACAIVSSIGDTARFVPLDVSDEDAWIGLRSEATSAFGRIDGLVNNAGVLRPGRIADADVADLRAMIDVNLLGTILGIKHLAPEIAAAGGGSIVNTSSVAGATGIAGVAGYSATKFAIRGVTRVAALEFAAEGVRVNCVLPGRVDTDMSDVAGARGDSTGIPLGRVAEPDDIAQVVMWLLSDAARYCTGTDVVVDGGVLAGFGGGRT